MDGYYDITSRGIVIGRLLGEPISRTGTVESRIITNLAFDLRFETSERVAIELASLDDPSASSAARQQAAAIRVALQRADKASWVDLDADVTRMSVQQLEALGLIAEGRATEILDAEVQDSERPS